MLSEWWNHYLNYAPLPTLPSTAHTQKPGFLTNRGISTTGHSIVIRFVFTIYERSTMGWALCFLWFSWQPFRNEILSIYLVHRTYIDNLVHGTNKSSVNSIITIIITIIILLSPHSSLQTCPLCLLNIPQSLLFIILLLPLNLNAHRLSPGELWWASNNSLHPTSSSFNFFSIKQPRQPF